MKKIFFLFLILAFGFVSCKKEPKLHKIKYQITFMEIPSWSSSNAIEVTATPCYYGAYNNDVDENGNVIEPYIDYSQTQDGLWEYEYWKLQDGDKVRFHLIAQLSYHYVLKVFIDDVEISHKEIKISDYNYGEVVYLDESGIDDTPGDSDIEFTFYESN